jgi:hypothetical protein
VVAGEGATAGVDCGMVEDEAADDGEVVVVMSAVICVGDWTTWNRLPSSPDEKRSNSDIDLDLLLNSADELSVRNPPVVS